MIFSRLPIWGTALRIDKDYVTFDGVEQQRSVVHAVLMVKGIWLQVLQLCRIIVVCTGTLADIQKSEQQFNLRVFKDLVRLRQKGEAEFFEMDQAENVKEEILEFRVKSVEQRDFVKEIVVVIQKLTGLKHLRELALFISFV